jgi:hypothetical protein
MDVITSTPRIHYSLDRLKEEILSLVERGIIRRHQQLYVLCEYLPPREWVGIESELEKFGYLLRDRVVDLVGEPKWDDD